jgi:hypothetical protein
MNKNHLFEFFQKLSSTGWRRGGRKRTFGNLSSEEVFEILRRLSEDTGPIEDLVKFVKGHKKIAREMTLENVQEAFSLFKTQEILEK